MSDLSLAQKIEIGGLFNRKALIVNDKGDLSVDGTVLTNGPDGIRTFDLVQEGIEQDASELGPNGAVKLYRKLAKTPYRLGKVLKAGQNIARVVDADRVAGR